MSIQEDQTFTKISAADPVLASRQFEGCKFINCDLANANLGGILFIDCLFEGCNLAQANIANTGFQHIKFKQCKLNGLNFSKSQDFLMKMFFDDCVLDNVVFYQKKNK